LLGQSQQFFEGRSYHKRETFGKKNTRQVSAANRLRLERQLTEHYLDDPGFVDWSVGFG
jgi:hypothetical protein